MIGSNIVSRWELACKSDNAEGTPMADELRVVKCLLGLIGGTVDKWRSDSRYTP